jgi:hypothetical protein
MGNPLPTPDGDYLRMVIYGGMAVVAIERGNYAVGAALAERAARIAARGVYGVGR